jgi:hypothetical protein
VISAARETLECHSSWIDVTLERVAEGHDAQPLFRHSQPLGGVYSRLMLRERREPPPLARIHISSWCAQPLEGTQSYGDSWVGWGVLYHHNTNDGLIVHNN